MSRRHCGIWIDQEEAVIVGFDADGASETGHIESAAGGRHKSVGGMSGTRGHVGGVSHKKAEHRRLQELSRFYAQVAEAVRTADRIAIIGPGEAKKHLESALREVGGGDANIVAVLPEDRLTPRRIEARLREVLEVPAPDG
jgi:hypothetical protein